MSGDLVKQVWGLDLPAHQADVLIWLAWYADENGEHSFPGVARLAWILRRGERAIQKSLRELRTKELIEVTHNATGGRGQVRGYRLHLGKGELRATFTELKGEPPGTLTEEKGELGSGKGESWDIKGEPANSARDREVLTGTNSLREQRRPKRTWEPPEWFRPLTTLEGYRRLDYSKLAAKLAGVCEAAGVAPGDVVNAFAEYWPVGRIKHGWGSPTNALERTIVVQISKVKGGSWNGARALKRRGHAPADYAAAREADEAATKRVQEMRT